MPPASTMPENQCRRNQYQGDGSTPRVCLHLTLLVSLHLLNLRTSKTFDISMTGPSFRYLMHRELGLRQWAVGRKSLDESV